MNLVSVWAVFGVGVAGGGIAELLHWWGLRQQAVLPQYVRSVFYWMLTAGMAVVGGLMALLYFGGRADGIVVFHVGASTPILLQKLVSSLPVTGGGKEAVAGPTIRRFFRW